MVATNLKAVDDVLCQSLDDAQSLMRNHHPCGRSSDRSGLISVDGSHGHVELPMRLVASCLITDGGKNALRVTPGNGTVLPVSKKGDCMV